MLEIQKCLLIIIKKAVNKKGGVEMKKYKWILIGVLSTTFILNMSSVTWSEQKLSPTIQKQKIVPSINKEQKIPSTQQPVITDGGSSETYDPGIDLVVSKVEITRGTFGSNPDPRIKIVPYIKNMWRGRTSKRIKIWFDGLSYAGWTTGIGPNEEKMGGAYYFSDPTGTRSLSFSVEVDNNNDIPENNDHNNRCENITLSSTQSGKTHTCPIVGPHEPLR